MSMLTNMIIASHVINILGAFYIIIISLMLFKSTKIKLILLLTSILIGWICVQTIEVLLIYEKPNNLFLDLVAIYNIILIIIIAFFLLFIDLFEGELSLLKIILASSAISISIILSLLSVLKDPTILFTYIHLQEFNSFNWSKIFSTILDPFIVLVGILSYHDLSSSLKYAVSEHQKRQIIKLRYGIIFIFFAATIIEVISIYLIKIPQYETFGVFLRFVVASLLIGIGMFYMGNAYATSRQLSLLQPQKMEYLLTINKAGLPLFEYKFRKSELTQESVLISGAIIAITSLMEEAFGINSNMQLIKFEDTDIMVEIRKDIAFMLVTEKTSVFLSKSLKMFANSFVEKFKDQIETYMGDTTAFQGSTDLLIKSFGLPEN